MKSILAIVLSIGFLVAALLWAHPESIVLMRGDYEFDQWMFIPVSSKTWLLLSVLSTIGGCIGFIFYRLIKKTR